jgi:hypothetical protein
VDNVHQGNFQEDELLREYPNNCVDRLRWLKTAICSNMEKIDFDNDAVRSHKQLFPSSRINNQQSWQPHFVWPPSQGATGIGCGYRENHKGVKPAQLRETRDEYKQFTDNIQWSKAVNKEEEKQSRKSCFGQIREIEKGKRGMQNEERHSYNHFSSCSRSNKF